MSDLSQRITTLSQEQLADFLQRLGKKKRQETAEEPIRPRGHAGPVPLSFSQERLWFLDQLEPGTPHYNMAAAVTLAGELRPALLHQAIHAVVQRHEALRTTFTTEKEGEPVQVVAPALDLDLPLLDVSALPDSARQDELDRLVSESTLRPFELGRGPLLHTWLVRAGAHDHVLLFCIHHIVTDGWSMTVFMREVAAFYEAGAAGRPAALPALAIQYPDFAVWQRGLLQGPALGRLVSYWRERLEGVPVLELPTDRPRPAVLSRRGANHRFEIPPDLTAALRLHAQTDGGTLFMVLLAAFKTVLCRWSGQDDLAVGTFIANRNRSQIEGLIGFFVNNLPLRTRFAPELTFRELLARVQDTTVGAYAHQDLPFEKLLEELKPRRSTSHTPIFQTMLVLQNTPKTRLELPGLTLDQVHLGSEQSNFDLTLWIEEEDGLAVRLEHATDLFDPATASRLARHFLSALRGAVANPGRRLWELPLLDEHERQQLLAWATPAGDVLTDGLVHHLFEEQARARPDAAALVVDGQTETYGELAARVHHLAQTLRRLGVGPEEPVGVCVDPPAEVVVPLLAILKAGGAFLPLDPAYPADRLQFMVEDAGARLVVTQERLATRLPDGVRRVLLDTEAADLAADSDRIVEDVAGPENLAYIIYTSGTTGRPKGVPITHRNLLPMMLWGRRCFGLDERTRVLQNLSYGFDFGVFEILTTLFSGGSLHFPGGVRGDFVRQAAYIAEHGIDTVHTTPSFFREILAAGAPVGALRIVHLGGEALTRGLVDQIFAAAGKESAVRVFNGYGPTEATVNSSIFEAERTERAESRESAVLPIGRATAANAVYLLDAWRGLVPVGVPGELCVGGPGVARGYLARPELTASKFVPDPLGVTPGGRLYRSGDLARWLPTGDVEFLGRIDQQVKIRGYRVELEEIEAVLRTCPGVRETAVAVRTDGVGGQRLAAWLVLSEGADVTAAAVRAYAEPRLPAYMVPAAVVFLTALPLTASGKVDRRALPEPDLSRPELGQAYVAPRTPTEEVVAGIWAEVLGVSRVGVHDGFFELGGHSLLATQIVARLREALGVELPLHSFFESPSVAELAETIEEERHPEVPPVRPVPRDAPLPLSFAQERLWFLERLHPGHTAYYVPRAVRIRGALDVPRLARAYGEMVERHEVLRTTFPEVDGRPVQVIHAAWPFHLPLVDLRGLSAATRESETRRLLRDEGQRSFDLARDPLIRATALRMEESEHLLLQTEHHLVHDGWAQGVLLRDLLELYRALGSRRPPELPPLPVQYADFAAWQREWLSGEVLEEQVSFWVRQLTGAPPLMELPTDRPRPSVLGSRGGEHLFDLTPSLADELRAFARRQGVTLFMAMLSVFDVLLHRVSGQTDLVLGSGVANRRRPETEGMIGMMVNTLVLRADLAGSPTLRELVQRVRAVCLGAYAHQDLPFDKLVEALRPERSTSHSPIFQVLYAFNDAPTPEWEMEGLRVEEVPAHNRSAKFDLLVVVSPHAEQRTAFATRARGSGINVALEYNLELFDGPTTLRLLHCYQTLLEEACADPDRRIGELPLLREGERFQLLVEWNDSRSEFPHLCIHEIFAEQARRTPGAVAVELGEERLTYGELESRANRLAHRLLRLGAGPEIPVALAAARSLDMIVGLLAILKSGGYYLPLDPQAPPERQALLLEEAGAHVLLSAALDEDWMAEEDSDPGVTVGPDNLAYVMYTSGSTGRPKGVSVPHRAIVRLVRGNDFADFAGEVFLQLAPLAFDASTLEIWGALLNGGRLVLMPAGTPSLEELGGVLRHHGVTTLWLTAGLFHQMVEGHLEDLAGLRQLLAGGDVLSVPHVRRVREHLPGLRLINGYGPTEGTTFTCCHTVGAERGNRGPDASVPVGRPIRNTRIHVLNADRQLQPVGAPGELCIGGDGLARGYLARPDLTAEAFVPDPFGPPGARCYRTGDRVRRLADGTVEFLGRLDHQVKIRGFRIEPGEIEAVLLRHPGVREVAVVVLESGNDKRLVAFVAPEPEVSLAAGELRNLLRGTLPEYMVPAVFTVVDALPLGATGKVDRRALARLAQPEAVTTGIAPRTPVEELLASLFAEVLGQPKVGIEDGFFDLGGHSLLATRLVSRVRAVFAVELPLRSLFEAQTVAALAPRIEELARESSGALPPPLERVPRDGDLPLSFAQQRLWWIGQLEPGSVAYNVPMAVRLRGPLDPEVLERSFSEIIRRHETLRTVFPTVESEARQRLLPLEPVQLPWVDLSALPHDLRWSEALLQATEQARRPFDLSTGPLLRLGLLRLDSEDWMLVGVMHHIITDGWSMGILVKELAALYEAFREGRPSPLPELPVQYADFAAWQRRWLEGDGLERHLAYWRGRLNGAGALELPTDRPRPPVRRERGGRRPVQLPPSLSAEIAGLSRRLGVTPFMVLLAAFQALLARIAGRSDVSIGTPIAGRTRVEVEGLIGFFVNTLVLRTELESGESFAALLGRVRDQTLAAYAHQDVPFERLVLELAPERSLAHTPLFQVMLALQNTPSSRLESEGLVLETVPVEPGASKFDLVLSLAEGDAGLSGGLRYATDLFDATTIDRLIAAFARLLEGVVAAPEERPVELPLLGGHERFQVLVEWNDTAVPLPGLCLHDLFTAQAERTPGAVALELEGETLSYGELDERSSRWAARLRALGVGPDVPVGICLERSFDMVVAVLAVLRAGGAYLPLDPEYPRERLALLLADARPVVVLTISRLMPDLPSGDTPLLCLDEETGAARLSEGTKAARPENLACSLYTSGSTGTPKGVMATHAGMVNRLLWAQRTYPLAADDRVLQSASFSFDFALWEIFAPLLAGARVVLARPGGHRDSVYLADLIARQRITVAHFIPSMLRIFLDEDRVEECRELRMVFSGGEALPADLRERFFRRLGAAELRNQYGPTEASIDVTHWLCRSGEGDGIVPIGRPVDNTRLVLLDRALRPVPIGVAGELCVGGVQIARGYLGRPDVTAERFIPDPGNGPGERLYRTGDLARFRADGALEFLGRLDHQVKVRGFRIELGEIEAILESLPGVREAAVDVLGDGPARRLVAWVVPAGEGISVAGLRAVLQEHLPEPMVPATWMLLPSLPLNPNGKLDRLALPDPGLAMIERAAVAPRTPVEEIVAGIWADLLGYERIGVHDNFFNLGGHSLLATRVMSRLRAAFGVELPLRVLFENHTLEHFSAIVEAAAREEVVEAPPIVPVPRDVPGMRLPLSFEQQRLWFLDRLQAGSAAYHIPFALELAGRLDLAALARSFDEIAWRHEALRTTFHDGEDGWPTQEISLAPIADFALIDLAALSPEVRQTEARRLRGDEARHPFRLDRDRLLRARLLRLAGEEHQICLTLHHIASDGWSTGVLVREIGALYSAFCAGRPSPLPDLPVQYVDYAVWQRNWLRGEALAAQLAYWNRQLDGVWPALELPTDRPRQDNLTTTGAVHRFTLNGELASSLRGVARERSATLFMTLLAAFQALLARFTGQDSIAVGSPVANRHRSEIEGLIGFFVNTLMLRTDLSGDPSFAILLGRAREVSLGAQANQDLPFERLVEELAADRERSPASPLQVLFTLQNAAVVLPELPGLTANPLEISNGAAKAELSLSMTEVDGAITGSLEYNTALFDSPTVVRMAEHFRTLVQGAATAPDRRLSEVPLLSPAERHQILIEWARSEDRAAVGGSITALFQALAERTPEAAALVSSGAVVTYGELAVQVNRLARHLQSRGVAPEVTVGICLDSPAEIVLALLAILTAGGAFLPLDPSHPAERLRFILEDAQAGLVVTRRPLLDRAGGGSAAAPVLLDSEAEAIAAEGGGPVIAVGLRESLAYVIYTSGTTGQPKGVAISHSTLLPMLTWGIERFDLGEHTRVLQNLAPWFDFGVFEILTTLLAGGALYIPEDRQDASRQAAYLREYRIDTLHSTPSFFREALAAEEVFPDLRVLHLGGEALHLSAVQRIFEAVGDGCRLYNGYGPTEATINCALSAVGSRRDCRGRGSAAIPIGRVTARHTLYVLDKDGKPVAVGIPGELWVGGDGLARGYLHRPGPTAERFQPDPFSGQAGARLYRTGDLVRYLPTGDIEFLGRIDQQVKLRGLRIELGEIEAVLSGHPDVREAVVQLREDRPGDQRLVAYVICAEGSSPAAELRNLAVSRLPSALVPSLVVFLDTFPRTSTGKVDRRALPAPDSANAGAEGESVAPRTPLEEVIAGLWTEVLGLERVGAHDSFFDLGGHSLLATRLVARIRSVCGVEIPLRAVFERPTVAELAAAVEEALRSASDTPVVPPLVPVRREEPLPLSFAQERLWFLDRLQPGSGAYNIPFALELAGQLDVAVLACSLAEIVRRHEALRTTICEAGGWPVQVVAPASIDPAGLDLAMIDLGDLPAEVWPAEAQRLRDEEARCPFRIDREPLLRVRLYRRSGELHQISLTFHHIVSDGWSVGIFVRELGALYEAFAAARPSPLAELPIQYADYAHWQRQWLTGETLESEIAWWREHLANLPPVLELHTDRPRPAVRIGRGAGQGLALQSDLVRSLTALGQSRGATLYMVLLTAFEALLLRHSGQEDLAVGTPVAGRRHLEVEPLIGLFINTLVLRADLAGDPAFGSLLAQVRESALGSFVHADMPFEKVVEALQPQRNLSHTPLFQVMFQLQSGLVDRLDLPGLSLSPIPTETGIARFDLTLTLVERQGGMVGSLSYDRDLFDATTITRLGMHFINLLEAVAENPEQRLSDVSLLSPAERHQLVREWSDTAEAVLGGPCVHRWIEAQARRTPEAVALVCDDRSWNYRELNSAANRLARHLRAQGVGPETLVAVCVERSAEMLLAVLAVMKSGGTYLPLDPAHPRDRLAAILEDAGWPLLLAQDHLLDALPEGFGRAVRLEADRELIARQSSEILDGSAEGEELAYVIYTSGSTGRPKGVQVPRRGLANFLATLCGRALLTPEDVLVAVTTLSFDIAGLELLLPLVTGARLVIARREETGDGVRLAGRLAASGATALQATPATWRQLLEAGWVPPRGFRVFCGGEALPGELAGRLIAHGAGLWNLYGPTETTIWSAIERVSSTDAAVVPLGRPLGNTGIHLLDLWWQPVPAGAPGELCIGGAGVARGYLRRPDLTAERFVPDPFASEPGARLYRTGDLACRLADGRLEFLGRLDHQVKIRGFRIELGEIEGALLQHPVIRQGVVVARQDPGSDRRLVAYVVAEEPVPTISDLRRFLRQKLPEYMLPAALVVLERMPLNTSGKVDRRALPAPSGDRPTLGSAYEAPRTNLETMIAGIWCELLQVDRVGVNDNFFDLGGHSLLLVRMRERLRESCGIELPVLDLFEHSTVGALARRLAEPADGAAPENVEEDRSAHVARGRERMQQRLALRRGKLPEV